jgi:peptidoglycan/LPS O-acetylase OafA/YrhL
MKYNPAIDGIRALAITNVVVFHTFPNTLRGGWIGVEVFFVLSGFLMTSIMLQEWQKFGTFDFRNFYIRRFLRVFPALLALVLFQVFRSSWSEAPEPILQSALMAVSGLMNWNRAFGWFPEDTIGHTWTLSMEEQFYLLWPLVLVFFKRPFLLLFLPLAILSVVLWRNGLVFYGAQLMRYYNGFDSHCDGLLIGAYLAVLKPILERKLAPPLIYIPALVILAASTFFQDYKTLYTSTIGFDVISVCSAILVWSCLVVNPVHTFLSMKPLVYIGKISYGWYIWHFPMIVLGRPILVQLGVPLFGASLSVILLSLICGILSSIFLEGPALRLKSNFLPRSTLQLNQPQ